MPFVGYYLVSTSQLGESGNHMQRLAIFADPMEALNLVRFLCSRHCGGLRADS
jgi:hypothetical protein